VDVQWKGTAVKQCERAPHRSHKVIDDGIREPRSAHSSAPTIFQAPPRPSRKERSTRVGPTLRIWSSSTVNPTVSFRALKLMMIRSCVVHECESFAHLLVPMSVVAVDQADPYRIAMVSVDHPIPPATISRSSLFPSVRNRPERSPASRPTCSTTRSSIRATSVMQRVSTCR